MTARFFRSIVEPSAAINLEVFLSMAIGMSRQVESRDTIQITHKGEVLAMILPSSFSRPGVSFFTPNEFSQQLAYISHSAGHTIQPHLHNPVHREVHYTNEVLFLRRGTLRVDFYSEDREYLKSALLEAGDVILLIKGGHGFEVLDDIEMVEVKQGPYTGDRDKTRLFGPPPQIRFTDEQ